MEKTPLVTIQILNWNRADETIRAIKSAKAQTYPNIEIVVIDNGSTDDSIRKIETLYPEIKLLKLDQNYGCPGGRNRGIALCKGEYIFFCDNDGVLNKDAVKNAVFCALSDSRIAIVTGLIKEFNHESEIEVELKLSDPKYKETNLFNGGITLHKKSIYTGIDKYPDDYIYGGEETYLALRVLDAGYSIVRCNEVVLWHKKSKLARNIQKESLRAMGNQLMNSYQLYPTKYFMLFFVYFFVVYPFYAIRDKVFNEFIKTLPSYIKRLRTYKRRPIEKTTYKKFVQLSKT